MLKVLNNPINIIYIVKLNCLYNNKRKNGSHDAVIIASFHTRVNTDVNIALVFFRNLCREINENAKKHPDRNVRLCFDDVATRAIGSRRSFPDVCPETASLTPCALFYVVSRSWTLRATLQCLHQPVEGGFTIPMPCCAPWERKRVVGNNSTQHHSQHKCIQRFILSLHFIYLWLMIFMQKVCAQAAN